jgi:hypothetical protein
VVAEHLFGDQGEGEGGAERSISGPRTYAKAVII